MCEDFEKVNDDYVQPGTGICHKLKQICFCDGDKARCEASLIAPDLTK